MPVTQAVRRSVSGLYGDGRGRVLASIAMGWALLVGTRMSYPVVLPYIREAYGLSLSVAGLLVTILWLGSALGQLPGGILADRYSERRIMAISLFVVAAALSLVALTASSLVVFLATGLVGLGLSMYPIARITILSAIFPTNIGSVLGVTMATGDVGQTIMPPIAGALAAAVAWQLGLGYLVPLFVLFGFLIWFVVPEREADEGADDPLTLERARAVLAELRTAEIGLVTLVLFVYIFVWQSFTGFYPTYLVDVKGFSPSVAGTIFALFFGVGVLVKPVSGTAYDRIGMRASLLLVLIGPIGGLAVLPFVAGFWPIVAVTALVSTMLGSGAITQSYLADTIPTNVRGTGLGVVRTTAATLGSAGPVLFGVIADRGYFDEGYFALAALMALIVLITLQMPKQPTGG